MSHNGYSGYPGAGQNTMVTAAAVAYGPIPTDPYRSFLNVMSRYDMPEEAKDCLSKMQEYIDSVEDGKEPTKEQWLCIRENMLKFWAIMMTHVLTKDSEAAAYKDRINAMLDLQAKQEAWKNAYQIYQTSSKI
jgi:hypothetical protein